MSSTRNSVLVAATLLTISVSAYGMDNNGGAVELSGGYLVPQNASPPKLILDTEQKEEIRKKLLTKNTEVEFKLKTTKPAKSFIPKIGAKLPKGVKPDGLPSELIEEMPQLADYGYSKMKDQILLVNEMTGRIVEIVPERQFQAIGQQ